MEGIKEAAQWLKCSLVLGLITPTEGAYFAPRPTLEAWWCLKGADQFGQQRLPLWRGYRSGGSPSSILCIPPAHGQCSSTWAVKSSPRTHTRGSCCRLPPGMLAWQYTEDRGQTAAAHENMSCAFGWRVVNFTGPSPWNAWSRSPSNYPLDGLRKRLRLCGLLRRRGGRKLWQRIRRSGRGWIVHIWSFGSGFGDGGLNFACGASSCGGSALIGDE